MGSRRGRGGHWTMLMLPMMTMADRIWIPPSHLTVGAFRAVGASDQSTAVLRPHSVEVSNPWNM